MLREASAGYSASVPTVLIADIFNKIIYFLLQEG